MGTVNRTWGVAGMWRDCACRIDLKPEEIRSYPPVREGAREENPVSAVVWRDPATAREVGWEWPLLPPAIRAPPPAAPHCQTQLEAIGRGSLDDGVHKGWVLCAPHEAEMGIGWMGKEEIHWSFSVKSFLPLNLNHSHGHTHILIFPNKTAYVGLREAVYI